MQKILSGLAIAYLLIVLFTLSQQSHAKSNDTIPFLVPNNQTEVHEVYSLICMVQGKGIVTVIQTGNKVFFNEALKETIRFAEHIGYNYKNNCEIKIDHNSELKSLK